VFERFLPEKLCDTFIPLIETRCCSLRLRLDRLKALDGIRDLVVIDGLVVGAALCRVRDYAA